MGEEEAQEGEDTQQELLRQQQQQQEDEEDEEGTETPAKLQRFEDAEALPAPMTPPPRRQAASVSATPNDMLQGLLRSMSAGSEDRAPAACACFESVPSPAH